MAYHEAKRFIEAFPEAKAWSVSVLSQDKSKALVQRPQCSREVLLRELNAWMKIPQSHFFLRPLLSNVVLLDLDGCKVDLQTLLSLQPRALVLTSPPNNLQMWLCIPDSLSNKASLLVCKELTTQFSGGNFSRLKDSPIFPRKNKVIHPSNPSST